MRETFGRSFPVLDVNPPSLDFGEVTTGQTAQLFIELFNESLDIDIDITSVTCDNGAFAMTAVTSPLAAQDSAIITITYSAGAVGAVSATITIRTSAINDPITIAVTANCVAAGTKAISISPSSWVFDPTKGGVDSATQTFIVTNTGTLNVTVQIPVLTAPFIGVGLPGAPTVLTPGTALTFSAKFHPSGGGYYENVAGLVITSDAASSPDNVRLEGMGILITPAYSVTDGVENGFAGFRNTIRQFDCADFNCEAPAFAERLIDPAGMGYIARTERLQLRYENMGKATVTVLVTNERDETSEDTVPIGSTPADAKDRSKLADVKLSGELLTVRITPNGPLWLTAWGMRWTPAGEVQNP